MIAQFAGVHLEQGHGVEDDDRCTCNSQQWRDGNRDTAGQGLPGEPTTLHKMGDDSKLLAKLLETPHERTKIKYTYSLNGWMLKQSECPSADLQAQNSWLACVLCKVGHATDEVR